MKSYYVIHRRYAETSVNNITAGKAKSIMRMHGVHSHHITKEPGLYTEITFTKEGMYQGTYFTKTHKLIYWS